MFVCGVQAGQSSSDDESDEDDSVDDDDPQNILLVNFIIYTNQLLSLAK